MDVRCLFLAVCLVASASGAIDLFIGQCPQVPTKPDFELNKYLGLWFSYANFDAIFQFGSSCVRALYSLKSDGKIKVVNSGSFDFRLFGRSVWRVPIRIEGEAFIVDPQTPGGLNVKFGNQPDMGGKANYLIMDTDYDNYSVVYSCTELGSARNELAWILTRQKGVRPANLDNIYQRLTGYGVNVTNFKLIDHSNC
ncbi:apolipoprotein D [Elysia marginata]|uniref:Apolipoprotein D n=1 Tax=Elysia marginata TaxID=1093978 RepID=A0AAV4JBF2_9GAST|nr:apolipoprotein D [Elysia marginata]